MTLPTFLECKLSGSLLNWWDVGKQHLKELTISFCSAKRKEDRRDLENQIQSLKSKVGSGDNSCLTRYKEVLEDLAVLDHRLTGLKPLLFSQA